MYLAAVDFGTISSEQLVHNVVAAILYFVIGSVILTAGFFMVDVLTPGSLRRMVFIERRPNAVAIACGVYAALALVVVTAILASSSELGQGLVDAAVYGVVGIGLQGAALVVLELAVPGRFRDLLCDERLHPAAIATAVMLVAIGGVNAAALS
jgi:uncharacterized membrane protein YjfL (UPF0719 family)